MVSRNRLTSFELGTFVLAGWPAIGIPGPFGSCCGIPGDPTYPPTGLYACTCGPPVVPGGWTGAFHCMPAGG